MFPVSPGQGRVVVSKSEEQSPPPPPPRQLSPPLPFANGARTPSPLLPPKVSRTPPPLPPGRGRSPTVTPVAALAAGAAVMPRLNELLKVPPAAPRVERTHSFGPQVRSWEEIYASDLFCNKGRFEAVAGYYHERCSKLKGLDLDVAGCFHAAKLLLDADKPGCQVDDVSERLKAVKRCLNDCAMERFNRSNRSRELPAINLDGLWAILVRLEKLVPKP